MYGAAERAVGGVDTAATPNRVAAAVASPSIRLRRVTPEASEDVESPMASS